MGCMVTRDGMHRHSYAAGEPARVLGHAFTASVQHPTAGATVLPLSSGVASFAADGAPFYNSGWMPGYQSVALPGGEVGLALPPRAAQLDLTDRQSWDRPVFWPGAA